MYGSKSLVIILLAAVELTLMVPAVSGISLLRQQAKGETSGQNGKEGIKECDERQACPVDGGAGGRDNVGNRDFSFSGNGGMVVEY